MLRLVIWPRVMLLGWTEIKLWTLKYGSKSIQTFLILRKRPPKPYIIFYQFCDNCKILSRTFYLKEDQMKIAMFAHFKEYHGNHKKFKSLYDFGRRCQKIRDVCKDFEPYFKVHNLVSVHPKSVILGQMTNLNMIFHVVVSVYRLVNIWNSPQFPDELRNG